jgi:hypothetical protein
MVDVDGKLRWGDNVDEAPLDRRTTRIVDPSELAGSASSPRQLDEVTQRSTSATDAMQS